MASITTNHTLHLAKVIPWPPRHIGNEFSIASLSLGNHRKHKLVPRLEAAAAAGYPSIELFDEDWEGYLEENGLDRSQPWDPTPEKLALARKLGETVKSLGMRIGCTQPMRKGAGLVDPEEKRRAREAIAGRMSFMREFDTDLMLMCASVKLREDDGVTADLKVVAKDLAEIGDMAAEFSRRDGGPMIRIGYEGLSWATRNTWSTSWEAVRAANKPNVGLIIDAFNILAMEWADPYNTAMHGRLHDDLGEAIEILCLSLAHLTATIPGDRIFFFQVGDAELVDPQFLPPPTNPDIPPLMPWSRGHRLFPLENTKGGYMPVELVIATVIATGYQGPISVEVFNNSLQLEGESIPAEHAVRGMSGLQRVSKILPHIPPFWDPSREVSVEELVQLYKSNRIRRPSL